MSDAAQMFTVCLAAAVLGGALGACASWAEANRNIGSATRVGADVSACVESYDEEQPAALNVLIACTSYAYGQESLRRSNAAEAAAASRGDE